MLLIDERADKYMANYNATKRGPGYDRIARLVYSERRRLANPLVAAFERTLIQGLVGFDMRRTITEGFALRLSHCMTEFRLSGGGLLIDCPLSGIDLEAQGALIAKAYACFAPAGTLHKIKQSHVAATKILHWLNPDLFIIVDSNVARAFRNRFAMNFRDTTQPGYTPQKYLLCLRHAQSEIKAFGLDRFRTLEPGTPEARIFDKIAFAVGVEVRRARDSKRTGPIL